MNKFICSVFAATLSLSTYSAMAATTSPGNSSDIANEDSPQQVEQSKGMNHKTSNKHSSYKNRMHKSDSDMKMMDTNGDGRISQDEYMTYHEQRFGNLKQTEDGFVTYKNMHAGMYRGINNNSLNNKPIGTTSGVSSNGSTDDTKDGPINGTHTGTNN